MVEPEVRPLPPDMQLANCIGMTAERQSEIEFILLHVDDILKELAVKRRAFRKRSSSALWKVEFVRKMLANHRDAAHQLFIKLRDYETEINQGSQTEIAS